VLGLFIAFVATLLTYRSRAAYQICYEVYELADGISAGVIQIDGSFDVALISRRIWNLTVRRVM
jgi:hypothetical protein